MYHQRRETESLGLLKLVPILALIVLLIGMSAFFAAERNAPSLTRITASQHGRISRLSAQAAPLPANECVKIYPAREVAPKETVVRIHWDAECVLYTQKKSVLNATYAKYLLISSLLNNGSSAFFFSVPGGTFGDPLEYLVHDTDIEVRSLGCPHTYVGKKHYEFEECRRVMDLYNGYWHLEYATSVGRALWGCGTAWFFVEAGFDPRVFYLRKTAASIYWIDEVLTYLERELEKSGEDFSETHMFNTLLTRRLDKYMTVRKFPVDMYISDSCAMVSVASTGQDGGVVGRIHGQWMSAQKRDHFNNKFRPRTKPLVEAPQTPVEDIPCTNSDPMCVMLERVALTHPSLKEKVVGLVVVKGEYTTANILASKMPRADLARHTLCACLDSAGCQSCTHLGMMPWPTKEEISVATLAPQSIRELYNMYKYHIALSIVKRDFSVFSYDLDILFLREPWPHFADERFDIWVSSDAHVGSWTTNEHTYDLFSYIRTSVNAGLWYIRPTKGGRQLLWRISSQLNSTSDQGGRVSPYFFEQAQFATVVFQTRCAQGEYCQSDARWKILSPTLFVPSKAGWQHTGDAGSMCNSVALHNNYGCPSWNLGRGKYEWLYDVAVNCGAMKP